jgi:glycosyltransferase involved in cell wall biosynthesis
MNNIVSIIPYKILPARLGGEKGIALFNEYLGRLIPVTGISTKNNDVSAAKNYKVLNILSNSRWRYANIFLYFTVKKIIVNERANQLLIEHPYYGWLAWLLRRNLPVKWIVHSHNIEYMRSRSIGRWWWKALKWYETWVYKKADIIFFISEDDLAHALTHLNINPEKSYAVTYGVEIDSIPSDVEISRQKIRRLYDIEKEEKILLFNGALYHHSNYNALSVILEKVNPVLLGKGIKYKIIVCGKGLPDSFRELKPYSNKNIIYAGFVDDIDIYFKAAHIFLNPIVSGGGVKTKAVEAIAMNCTVISTEFGAMGLKRTVCADKLQVVEDNNWNAFTQRLLEILSLEINTQPAFYDYYYWGNIAAKVAAIINSNSPRINTPNK